jgi:hypothetical protein
MSTADLTTLVDDLDPDAIQAKLEDLGRQAKALRVLLRAARARSRARDRKARPPSPMKGGPHDAA